MSCKFIWLQDIPHLLFRNHSFHSNTVNKFSCAHQIIWIITKLVTKACPHARLEYLHTNIMGLFPTLHLKSAVQHMWTNPRNRLPRGSKPGSSRNLYCFSQLSRPLDFEICSRWLDKSQNFVITSLTFDECVVHIYAFVRRLLVSLRWTTTMPISSLSPTTKTT